MYEFSVPYGMDLKNQMTADKSESRLLIRLNMATSKESIEFNERTDEWIKNNLDNKVLGLFVILNFGICSIIFIVLQDGKIISPYLLYLLIILNTAIFDTFAYIVGSNFGKTQIAKKTSPKKSYEGLFGGILFSGLYSYLICLIFNIDFLVIIYFIIGSIFE